MEKRRLRNARLLAAIAAGAVATGALAGAALHSFGQERPMSAAGEVVPNAQAACVALAGKSIPASAIKEPTSGAVVTSAVYKTAVPDHMGVRRGRGPAPAGRATPAGRGPATPVLIQGTPNYCEVLIDIKPVDPKAPPVKVEVNLPTDWNGKSLQFGGGGYNGRLVTGVQPSINAPPQTPLPLTQGYLTSGTDSGHEGFQADWALNNEALTNFAYAAYGKTHDAAWFLAKLYYGKAPAYSYFMGSSEGGHEAMTVAQRFPTDFDGVVAIDPVMNTNALQTFGNYVGGILQGRPGGWLDGKVQLVNDTILAACDAKDGITDGVVSNYANCKPAADAALSAKRCPSGRDDGPSCFSRAQLAVVMAALNGYRFDFPLANGIRAYSGYGYGGEEVEGNWSRWVVGSTAPTAPPQRGGGGIYNFGSIYVRYFIARNPGFNPLTYNPDKFKARVLQLSAMWDSTNPNLSAFFAHGGKLILREDMGDAAQSPWTGLNYWDAVVAKMGRAKVDQSFAAYVATGLPHVSGGIPAGTPNAPSYGIPGRVDLLARINNWVEKGVAPPPQLTLVNEQPKPPFDVTASKPMCRYGTYPRYVGATPAGGNDAKNYSCVPN
jgi:Tannase and feruloyl esterase